MGQIEPIAQFLEPRLGAAAAWDALRAAFVTAPPMVRVPVAEWSLQMPTFIHQSQLRSTLGISRCASFQGYLSPLLLPLLFFFCKGIEFLL